MLRFQLNSDNSKGQESVSFCDTTLGHKESSCRPFENCDLSWQVSWCPSRRLERWRWGTYIAWEFADSTIMRKWMWLFVNGCECKKKKSCFYRDGLFELVPKMGTFHRALGLCCRMVILHCSKWAAFFTFHLISLTQEDLTFWTHFIHLLILADSAFWYTQLIYMLYMIIAVLPQTASLCAGYGMFSVG